MYSIRIPIKVMVLIMKIIFSLLLSLLLLSSSVFAADTERWLLAGKDSPNNNSWYIDSRTLKIHDNSTVLFWAKVMLGDPKYDITEIKIKYLLSADRLQLTKLEEIGYSKAGETIWNNNVSKTISVIPGSGPEKLVLFVDDFVQKKTAEKTKQKAAAKQTENAVAAKAENPEVKEVQAPAAKVDAQEATAAKADTSKNTETQNTDNSAEQNSSRSSKKKLLILSKLMKMHIMSKLPKQLKLNTKQCRNNKKERILTLVKIRSFNLQLITAEPVLFHHDAA